MGFQSTIEKQQIHNGLAALSVHFLAGPSKWNKVEYRFFSYISKNWQSHPLIKVSYLIQTVDAV